MKGRTTCPKCKQEFVLDVLEKRDKHQVLCPNCGNKFAVHTTSSDTSSGKECTWEEHGEPRKTILSSIRPKTNKPLIAVILLVAVFVVGVTTAVFPETFFDSTLKVLSDIGFTGTVDILVMNQSNVTLDNVAITLGDVSGHTNVEGSFSITNVTLGLQTVTLNRSGYKTQTNEILVFPVILSSHTIIMEDGTGETHISFNTDGCTLILVIFSVFSLLAVVPAFRRQHFDVAVAGSVLGIFSFGFFMVGSILSIIALILIIKSREEFRNGKKGKIF